MNYLVTFRSSLSCFSTPSQFQEINRPDFTLICTPGKHTEVSRVAAALVHSRIWKTDAALV